MFESVQLLHIYFSMWHHTKILAIRVFESVQLLQIYFSIWQHAKVLAIRVFESVQLLSKIEGPAECGGTAECGFPHSAVLWF